MRNFRHSVLRFTIFSIFLALAFTKSNAQVSIYGFNASMGTYTPITGTVISPSGTWDDASGGVSVPLGFSFTFNNVAYTNCFVGWNGGITFGTAITTTNYAPISSTATYAGAISPYGRDLQAQATAPTGLVEWTSAAGVFTLQWSNSRRYNGTTVNTERIEFQIQLIQATGQIKFVYGTWSDAVSAATANNGEVGLRGASNADYRNLAVASGGDWATPTAGTSNTATVFYNQSSVATKPASGLTYTFSPPPPCVAPTAQPTNLILTPGVNNVNGAFTAAVPPADKYLVVRTPGVPLNATPVNGTLYTAGGTLGNGTIVAASTATTFNSTGLISSTNYTYTIFAYNEFCTSGPSYLTTAPLEASTTTGVPSTYSWNGTTSTDWQVAANWTPARTLVDATDRLEFSNGIANTVTNIPAQTISRLTFSNNTSASFRAAATATLTIASDNNAGTDELSIATGCAVKSDGSAFALTLAFSGTGATNTISGTLETICSPSGTITNLVNFTNTVTTVTATGTLASGGALGNGTVWTSTALNLIINGTYNHKYTGGNGCPIPTATWNTGSLVLVDGITTATGGPAGGTAQTFYNFTYNCPNQTSNSQWSATVPATVNGTFSVISTGSGQWLMASTQVMTLTIKDYVQTGGTVDISTSTAAKTLNITGTFNQTGGSIKATSTGTGVVTINYNGTTGAQNVNFFDAAPVGQFVYRVTNAAGINLTGTGALTSTFNINTGGGVIVSTLAATPIVTTLALTYAATGTTLTYNATGNNQVMTAEIFPVTFGPLNLTVAIGLGNVIDMPFNRTVGGTLVMTSGDINLSTNALTLGTSATAVGTLTYTAGNAIRITTGSFTRWFGVTGLPTTPGTGIGFYPMASGTSNRNVSIYFSIATAISTGGTIMVEHANLSGFTVVNPAVDDAGYQLERRTDANWKFTPAGFLVLSGTASFRITGGDVLPLTNNVNLRAMLASSVIGTHAAGTGAYPNYQVLRTGLTITDLTNTFYIGGSNTDLPSVFNAVTTGNWTTPATWQTGVVPGASDAAQINSGVNVTIDAAVSAKSLIVASGGTLTGAANSLTLEDALVNAGTATLSGAMITVGPTGGGNKVLINNGTLAVSAGTLEVNGNFLSNAGSTITQTGGDIRVDGNQQANPSNSVASGTTIMSLRTQNLNLTGGTITIVDPHANTTASNSFEYNTAAGHANLSTGNHTFVFGDGVSTDAGGNATNGMRINPAASTSRIAFGNVIINSGVGTNRYVTQASSFGVLKDFTVMDQAEFRLSTTTYFADSLTVNTGGTLTATSIVYFGTFLNNAVTAGTVKNIVSGDGLFRNSTSATPTANFTSITVNNSNGVSFQLPNNVSFSATTTFLAAGGQPSRIYIPTNQVYIELPGAGNAGAGILNGWVVGRLQKGAAIGGILNGYWNGDSTNYIPITISGTGTNPVASAGSIIVGTIPGEHPQIATSSINPLKSVNRHYTVQGVNGITFGSGQIQITFKYVNSDVDAGAVRANFIGDIYSGSWSVPPPTVGLKTDSTLQITGLGPNLDAEYAIGAPIPKVYTFTGSGNWDLPANWLGGLVPPAVLNPEDEIIVNGTGDAVINVPQTVAAGGKFTVKTGKNVIVNGNLTIN